MPLLRGCSLAYDLRLRDGLMANGGGQRWERRDEYADLDTA